MNRRVFLSDVLLLPTLFLHGCASAPQATPDGPRLSEHERQLISGHYAAERARVPPRAMPAQRVRPGDTLVSGSRPYHLPDALKARLTPPPAPYTVLALNADVMLLNRDTHVVADAIPQVAY